MQANELLNISIGPAELRAICENPSTYPEELLGAALNVVKDMQAQLREAKIHVEGVLLEKMQKENASKLPFIGVDGKNYMATVKSGAVECKDKTADMAYQNAGFDPREIGEYIFKPSWTKAKEARKLGGEKQLLIDELFRAGAPSLDIKEVN